jgi:hypothetical protein
VIGLIAAVPIVLWAFIEVSAWQQRRRLRRTPDVFDFSDLDRQRRRRIASGRWPR